MPKVLTVKLAEISAVAAAMAKRLKGGEILALIGGLGSGKTHFTKALAKQLKVKTKVVSPTFALMHRHQAKLQTGKKVLMFHLDLYRAKNFKEIKALGLKEFWGKNDCLTVIEWADKIKKHLPPKKTIVLRFIQL